MNKKKAGFGSIPNGSFSAYREDYGTRRKAEIIEMLRAEEPLTISAVRHRANVTSKTAKKWLLVLVDEEKVTMRQVEGTKLFFLNHNSGGKK